MMKRVYIGNKELTALATVTNGGGGGDDTQKWADYFNGTLTEFTVPEGVTNVNPNTFVSCTGLTSLTLPSSIISIGSDDEHGMGGRNNPFDNLQTMTVKATTPPTILGYEAIIPDTIEIIYVPKYSANIYKTIDKWNTYADKIQALPQNETVVTYNDGTTKKFDIKGDLTKDNIENITAATKVEIGDDVTSIGTFGFMYCGNITGISLSDSVTKLNMSAFAHTGIKTITIPSGVTSIGEFAFGYCTNLSSVIIQNSSSKLECNYDAFDNISSTAKLYVPSNLLADYQSDTKWVNAFKGGIFAVENIMKVTYLDNTEMTFNGSTAINQDTDSNKKNAKTVEIYDTVSLINKNAFNNCSGLTSVVIPDSVINIGDSAFNSCKSLTSVEIPDSVINIGDSAFNSCKSLTSVVIPDSVINIGDSAFYYCTSLTSVTIPDSVTSIGEDAFIGCKSLTSVTIPDSVTSIGNWTFGDCKSLTNVTLPSNLTSIGYAAFRECSSLTGVTIPNSVTNIGGFAFYYCTSLTSITIPASITSIEFDTFGNCSKLESVTIENSTSKLSYVNDSFEDTPSSKKLYVPSNLLADYQADSNWTGAFGGGIYAIGSSSDGSIHHGS